MAVNRKLPPVTDNRPAPGQTKLATDQPPVHKDQAQLDTESLAHLLNPPEESTPGGGSPADKPKEVPSVPLGEAVAQALQDRDAMPPPIVPKAEQPVEKVASAMKKVDTPDLTPSEPPAAAEPQPTKKAEPLPIKTTHEVQPGESLGKIAAKYYGRSTPQRIEALYNANRDVLPSVNAVKANIKLNIPDLGEKNDQFEPVSSFAGTQLADSRKAGLDKQPIVPLPIGDRTQPKDKQRDSASVSRATPAAVEKPTADQPAVEKNTPAKAESEKTASDKGTPGKKQGRQVAGRNQAGKVKVGEASRGKTQNRKARHRSEVRVVRGSGERHAGQDRGTKAGRSKAVQRDPAAEQRPHQRQERAQARRKAPSAGQQGRSELAGRDRRDGHVGRSGHAVTARQPGPAKVKHANASKPRKKRAR